MHVGRICVRSSTDPVATVLTQAATGTNLDDGAPRERSNTQTANVKCPEQANPQRQRANSRGGEVSRKRGATANGRGVFWGTMKTL